ncbi:MAG TPA: nuclear transport factor 2 family protein [Puia sp.]|nr:nuclear transport factor 2 family protein [Puia sp.]
MRKVFIPVLLFIISVPVFSQSGDIEIIKKLNESWLNCYITRDTAAMSKIYGDDFILISPSGSKVTKKDALKNLTSSTQNIISIKADSVEVRLLSDDVAVITSRAVFKSSKQGKETTGQTSYQDIYVKRNGRWVAVAAHVTFLGSE